jgi:hypothetical protein
MCSNLVGLMFPTSSVGPGGFYPYIDPYSFVKLTSEPVYDLFTLV